MSLLFLQELALYDLFSMGETLHYFGRLHGMSRKQIRQRIKFLLDFLTLPDDSKIINQLRLVQ